MKIAMKDKNKTHPIKKIDSLIKIVVEQLKKSGTRYKKADKKLKASENQLRKVLATIQEGVTFSDETGHFYVYNSAMEKLTGYSMEEANACQDFIGLLYPDAKNRQIALQGIGELLEKKISREMETIITKKNGQLKNVRISSSLIPYDGRNLFLSVYYDVTERKQAEEALQDAYNELKETQAQLIQAGKLEAIGIMASGVAHEVRNPLAIILQGINYLEDKFPPDKNDIRDVIQIIKKNISRADKIIRLLFDFSRAGELDKKEEDVNNILENSLELVQHRIKLRDTKIVKDLKKELPGVLVDKSKIEQVFINLLLNAIQAMPGPGRLSIRSYLTEFAMLKKEAGIRSDYFEAGEKLVVVEIEDTGVGVSQENLKKLFTPFFTTKGPEGSGLGLAISKNIIEIHRGIMDIKSQVGQGTKAVIGLKILKGK